AAPLPTSQVRRDSNLDPARQQLANTLVNLQTQQETLQQQLVSTIRDEQELRQAYTQVPNKQLEQARRQQQVLLKQELFNKMQAALADAQAAEAETVSSLNIAQGPQVQVDGSTATSAPATIGVGIFVGLLVAGGLIFVLASLDNTYYTPEEVRAALVQREVPLLGELPYIVLFTPTHSNIPVLLRSDSPYQEFYERFRSNLRRAENKALKVVLLTSTVAEEGKSLSAYNLAIASAQAGKRTLLVEADLRSASLAKSLGVSPDPAAAVEPLRYYNSKSECIRLVPDIENLYIVPSPGPQRQAAAIIESSELQQLLEDVRGRFDLVVVDTPALSRCNDALLLQPFTDGIVLVTRPGYTQETMLAEAVDELVDAELPMIGAIINGVDKPVALPNVVEEEEEDTLLEEEDEDFSEDLPEPGNVPTGASRF
nr:CpsD/CapB family tyrosine-protein kinase [Kastovskya adunca ATA6-11-RM4]